MNFSRAYAEINRKNVISNIEVLRRFAVNCEICLVVKADAYGHGAINIASVAQDCGVKTLGVATVSEGIELRDSGIQAEILLLSEPDPESLVEAVRHGLTPTVTSTVGMNKLRDCAVAFGELIKNDLMVETEVIPIHIKVETGMHRSGAQEETAFQLVKQVEVEQRFKLKGVWSHLACADERNNAANSLQINRFKNFVKLLKFKDRNSVKLHIANTAGLMMFKEAHFDMARSGIGVYGYYPSQVVKEQVTFAGNNSYGCLKPVLELKAKVRKVSMVKHGEGISYGHQFIADRDMEIATIPIGYADGIPRSLGRNGSSYFVIINNNPCKITGVVTMDHLMVDVTGLNVRPDDDVILIGRSKDCKIDAQDIADEIGTIHYEVLTRIGQRVQRIVV